MSRSARAALLVPLGIVMIVVMLVVPVPAAILDFLITLNISFAIIVLMVALRVKDPVEFSTFPSVLLVATMFRLALNVSATRLVLLRGYAGSVIQSFGHFVVGGSVVVGLVVFLILFVIQFVVITNGAGRVAEVGARFTLDAMPGKQMAIDADLNAGHINEAEARRRRERIAKESDFYGAMDGASKFVKGDAIAAVVITLVNLMGGFIVGVMQRHLPITQSIDTYSLLSVGDGLVSQIPALLMSISTGLIVTRSANEADFGLDLITQLSKQARALEMGGGVVAVLGLMPGLPKLPFIAVGMAIFLVGRRVRKGRELANQQAAELVEEREVPPSEIVAARPSVEPLELDLSLDLLELADPAEGGDLTDRIKTLRSKLAGELGVPLPQVRVRDDLSLAAGEYAIKVYEVEVARGSAPANRVLAIGDRLEGLPGEPTVEPVFQIPARWIPPGSKPHAIGLGATVVDRSSVIITHLSEVIRRHAPALVARQQVKEMLDQLKQYSPVVVDELTQAQVSLGELQQVFRDLLEEGVAVRNLPTIVEAIVDRTRVSRERDQLLDAARTALGSQVAVPYVAQGTLAVIQLDPALEDSLRTAQRVVDGRGILVISAEQMAALKNEVSDLRERGARIGADPVVLSGPAIRAALRRVLMAHGLDIPVLSHYEVPQSARVIQIGVANGIATAQV